MYVKTILTLGIFNVIYNVVKTLQSWTRPRVSLLRCDLDKCQIKIKTIFYLHFLGILDERPQDLTIVVVLKREKNLKRGWFFAIFGTIY